MLSPRQTNQPLNKGVKAMECMFEFQNKHGAAYDWSPEEVIYLLSPHRIIGDMDAGVADRQRQFSAALTRQMQSKGGEFDDLITKMLANLSSDLSVFRLAAMVGMSERSFARKFTATMGISRRALWKTCALMQLVKPSKGERPNYRNYRSFWALGTLNGCAGLSRETKGLLRPNTEPALANSCRETPETCDSRTIGIFATGCTR